MSRRNQPDPITPLVCSVPGCRYSTPVGIPDMPTVIQLLNIHDTQAHAVDRLREQTRLGEQQPPAPAPTTASTPAPSKAPARPRPMVNEDFSEADWQFFLSEWQSHKRALNISQTVHVLDELRICMGEGMTGQVIIHNPLREVVKIKSAKLGTLSQQGGWGLDG